MEMGKRSIYEHQDIVFPLKSQLLSIAAGDLETHIEVAKKKIPDPVDNERFREKVYVAPYSLLWHYRDKDSTPNNANGMVARIIDRIVGLAFDTIIWIKAMASTKPEIIRKTIITGCDAAVIAVNTLNPLHRPMVRLNFTSRKYHESPAIAALIRCRWNTAANIAWMMRIMYQTLFLTSVILISGNQIYPFLKLWNLIVPICLTMLLGLLGLYLELLEFIEDFELYMRYVKNKISRLKN
ncbi:MAG: hypothetical protein J3Q66DRAFT_191729 [Benniella sp.]|nr:MAG: hypothetical protein J3Q66DRAFT_191729 [Benniella sp.]